MLPPVERACAFDCPNCGEKLYIPVGFGGAAVDCSKCGAHVPMRQEWREQLQLFAELSGKPID